MIAHLLTTPSRESFAGNSRLVCRHCGTAFSGTEQEKEFCCSGCRFVSLLLHKRGLEDFYQYGKTHAPVGHGVFQERSWDWLLTLQQEAEKKTRGTEPALLELQVQGISCAGCVWLLEALFLDKPGAVGCRVDSTEGTIRLRWVPSLCDVPAYAADVQRFGYLLGPSGEGRTEQPLRPLVRRMGLCAALALNSMLFAMPRYLGIDPGDRLSELFDLIGFLLATASILIGGPVFFRRAWAALIRRDIHIDLPISVGLLFAYGGSVLAWRAGDHSFAYFDFVSIFTFLMLLGRWLQERAVESNRRRLLELRIDPGKVSILRNGIEREYPAEEIREGERYSISRNALVPVRSRLAGAKGLFALNWITGEPNPREYPDGASVPSGARNIGPDRLQFLALESWKDSQLFKLLDFENVRPWRNTRLQTIIRIYLSCVFVAAAAGFLYWGFAGTGWIAAWQVLISVLVVSCPCVLGVALPLLDDISAARLQKSGIYVRENTLWQRLRRVKQVLLDKTGTVTLEHLTLLNPESIHALQPMEKQCLLHLVDQSLHPVSVCMRGALLTAGVESSPAISGGVAELIGQGLVLQDDSGVWRLGKPSFALQSNSTRITGTVFSRNDAPLAVFEFCEELRPDAEEQVKKLLKRGLDLCLLSGDSAERVRAMSEKLGLPTSSALGDLSPEKKAELVRERWHNNALFLGDGANDSLAFDVSLCRGTPAVENGLLEQKADFYFLGRSLKGLGDLFQAANHHALATRIVFAFAITYNSLAVGAALLGFMNPLLAAIIMPLSSLISIGLVFLCLHPQEIAHRSRIETLLRRIFIRSQSTQSNS